MRLHWRQFSPNLQQRTTTTTTTQRRRMARRPPLGHRRPRHRSPALGTPAQMRRGRRRLHHPNEAPPLHGLPSQQPRRFAALHLRRDVRRGQTRQANPGGLHRAPVLRRGPPGTGGGTTTAAPPLVPRGTVPQRHHRAHRSARHERVEHARARRQALGALPATRAEDRRQGAQAHPSGGGRRGDSLLYDHPPEDETTRGRGEGGRGRPVRRLRVLRVHAVRGRDGVRAARVVARRAKRDAHGGHHAEFLQSAQFRRGVGADPLGEEEDVVQLAETAGGTVSRPGETSGGIESEGRIRYVGRRSGRTGEVEEEEGGEGTQEEGEEGAEEGGGVEGEEETVVEEGEMGRASHDGEERGRMRWRCCDERGFTRLLNPVKCVRVVDFFLFRWDLWDNTFCWWG
mmetsp:Transcript_22220/g.46474  ORF Transcript_22220/g.46474 Transcript_22220/m.46474 type:complete len:399 (+) Transcript_22220:1150-2346(+)